MRMRRKLNYAWILFCLFSVQVIAQNAVEMLKKASSAYEKSNGIAVTFLLQIDRPGQDADRFEGQIQMKGNKFTLNTPDLRVWFDGTTQWVYREQSEEVNITTPTDDELEQTNPIVLLNSYQKNYSASYKGESTTATAKPAYDVVLTPKKKGDVEKVELQIEKASQMPSRIFLQHKNGMYTTIRIGRIQTGQNQPGSFFVFKESDFPDVELIDLR